MSANIEILLLSRLLRGNKEDHEALRKYALQTSMFHTCTEHYKFVQDFDEKYGKLPGKRAFMLRFKDFPLKSTPESMAFYCDQLVERENLIRLRRAAAHVKPLLLEGKASDAIAQLRATLEVCAVRTQGHAHDWKNDTKGRLADLAQRGEDIRQGRCWTTPYSKLNKAVTVLRPENLVVLAARWAVGKTFIVLHFALHLMKLGAKVLVVSKEMSREEFVDRLDCIDAKLDFKKFLAGKLCAKQLKRYKKMLVRRKKRKGSIHILGDAQLSGGTIERFVSEIDSYGPDVVIVDGVAQFDTVGHRDEVQKVLYLSHMMKRVAKARKVLLILTVHQNRSAEGKKKGGGAGALSWGDVWGADCLPAETLLDCGDGLQYIADLVDTKFRLREIDDAIGDM